ncbi:MAG: NAD(P)/FAD-dependent oxidoreductase [Clostridia bacterium]|nr:NAD(P)/FAD-dependent oxidoreductase [Clostridia bacterium]
MTKDYDVLIIGGGAAGLFAAAVSARAGKKTAVIEKNDRCGKKLDITGKGRCNITNMCGGRDEFLANVPKNPRFLTSAISRFSPADTVEFFESLGVKTKVERGNRVFPQSDKAHDVTEALINAAKAAGARFIRGKATGISTENGEVNGVYCGNVFYGAKKVILAAGGASYPRTGSDGSGYALARNAGHTVTEIIPSLVPLVSPDQLCRDCMGLSLKNVGLTFVSESGKTLYSEQGEMLFTHFGVSGPVVLSASAYIGKNYPCVLYIDLKPALDEKTLDKRLLRDFSEGMNRELKNSLSALLPQKLIAPFIKATGIDPAKKLNSVTREERITIIALLKSLPVRITGTRPIDEAIVTSGGVSVKEIDPKTMESKLVKGLHFAGEVIDVDAYTGGFNLQIAFSTAYCAATAE